MFYNFFYKNEKHAFCVFYLQINVFNIYMYVLYHIAYSCF